MPDEEPALPETAITDADFAWLTAAADAYATAHPPPSYFLMPRVWCGILLERCIKNAMANNAPGSQALRDAILVCAQNFVTCRDQYSS